MRTNSGWIAAALLGLACGLGNSSVSAAPEGNANEDYPVRPITIICPWAAGGGTDRVSRQLAMQLEQKLQVPVNVINATGGKGVTGHNRGLTARPDGYTIAMLTFELNTMHWMKLTRLTYRDCIPLVSVNDDYASLLVAEDSAWRTLSDVEEAIRAAPKKFTASGTASGGAWHLALAGWLNAADIPADDVTWIPSQGSSPSLQQLLSGGVDMVCCSLPEARSLLEAGQVRAIGVMSSSPAVGFESVPTFESQGRNWTLGGWRGLAVPLGTPQDIVDKLRSGLVEIVQAPADEEGSFASFMQSQKFDSTSRTADEFFAFMAENDRKLGELLQSEALRSVSEDRFSPMTYPYIWAGLLLVSCVAMFATRADPVAASDPERRIASNTNFAAIVLAIIFYGLVAESLGFILTAGIVVLLLQIKLGCRIAPSLLVTLVATPVVYFVFAKLLRVSLPAGWLG